jgi:hypothetical protein
VTSERLRCRNCEKVLAKVYALPHVPPIRKVIGYGYAGSGFFCSRVCGHDWAVRLLRGDASTWGELTG